MKRITLHPSPFWQSPHHLPKVDVITEIQQDNLSFTFDIWDPPNCFRCECNQNGQPCWKDSCAEVFILSQKMNGYFNFETNSAGYCLAEFGQQRQSRRPCSAPDYDLFQRKILLTPTMENDSIHWSVQIVIPKSFVGILDDSNIKGNLYKCASAAQSPHYLMAFPIHTPSPDFHRPEYFDVLF